MIDPISAAIDGLQRGDAAKLPLVVFAGAITSVGPCVAPRYVALAALLQGGSRALITSAFVVGLTSAYALIGCAGGVLGILAVSVDAVDALLAAALFAYGLRTVLAPSLPCTHSSRAVARPRLSGAFLLGAASAVVVSPCCTPLVAAVVGMTAFDGTPLLGALFLAAFALGHALPLLLGACCGPLTARFEGWTASGAPAIVSGTLMIALAAYYAVQIV